MMNEKKIIHTVKKILDLLINKDYLEIEYLSHGIRLSANNIQEAINEYGCTITYPPLLFKMIDVVQIKGKTPLTYSVRLDLWTEEEGRSDLSLEMTLIDIGEGDYCKVEIDDIHVM